MMSGSPITGSFWLRPFTSIWPCGARAPATLIMPSGPRTTFGSSGSTSSNVLFGSIATSITSRVSVACTIGSGVADDRLDQARSPRPVGRMMAMSIVRLER